MPTGCTTFRCVPSASRDDADVTERGRILPRGRPDAQDPRRSRGEPLERLPDEAMHDAVTATHDALQSEELSQDHARSQLWMASERLRGCIEADPALAQSSFLLWPEMQVDARPGWVVDEQELGTRATGCLDRRERRVHRGSNTGDRTVDRYQEAVGLLAARIVEPGNVKQTIEASRDLLQRNGVQRALLLRWFSVTRQRIPNPPRAKNAAKVMVRRRILFEF